MAFTLRVAREVGEAQRVYGPFPSYEAAHEYGVPFAQEGLDVEVRRDVGVCDFCCSTSEKIAWAYSALDFGMPGTHWASRGDWAACDPCHALIEGNRWRELTQRSVDTFFVNNPTMPKGARKMVKKAIQELHLTFKVARLGRPRRP